MTRITTIILVTVIMLVIVSIVLAEDGQFEVAWHRMAGGGGTSADGDHYNLTGTIGQAETGVLMEGSSFQLSGGYWGGAGAKLPTNDLYLPMLLRIE